MAAHHGNGTALFLPEDENVRGRSLLDIQPQSALSKLSCQVILDVLMTAGHFLKTSSPELDPLAKLFQLVLRPCNAMLVGSCDQDLQLCHLDLMVEDGKLALTLLHGSRAILV